jgi:hypothetical protein
VNKVQSLLRIKGGCGFAGPHFTRGRRASARCGIVVKSLWVAIAEKLRVIGLSIKWSKSGKSVVSRICRESVHRCKPAGILVAMWIASIERTIVMEH